MRLLYIAESDGTVVYCGECRDCCILPRVTGLLCIAESVETVVYCGE